MQKISIFSANLAGGAGYVALGDQDDAGLVRPRLRERRACGHDGIQVADGAGRLRLRRVDQRGYLEHVGGKTSQRFCDVVLGDL